MTSPKPLRILVTGSRDWDHWPTIYDAILEAAGPEGDAVIVHGACPTGADRIADDAGDFYDIAVEHHHANWKKHGKRAGFIRHAQMIGLGADVCLAFIKNGSPGATMTADMAEKAGIPVRRFEDS